MRVQHLRVMNLRLGVVLFGLCALSPAALAADGGTIPTGPSSGTPSDPTIGSTAAPASMSGPAAMQPGTPTKADGAVPGTRVPATGSIGTSGSGNSRN